MVKQELRDKLRHLPSDPGVYLMKDDKATILYVGKAKNLKNRVSSYFYASKQHSPKTLALVEEIRDFDIFMVDSEVEALLLERTLIASHKPKYNILLRDDKEYPYLRIDFGSQWPRLRKVRQRKNDGAQYIGPIGNLAYFNTILQMAYDIFPLIRCSEHEFKTAKRPCNYYHMGKCLGPCTLPVDRTEYLTMIQNASDFLTGKNRTLQKSLQSKMNHAAETEQYELAARYRDQLIAYRGILEKQKVVIDDVTEADAIGIETKGDQASFHVLMIREGKLTGHDNFLLKMPLESVENALLEFIIQYYDKRYLPKEIYLPIEQEDHQVIEQMLNRAVGEESGQQVKIKIPKRGEKKQLTSMANRNAAYCLEERMRSDQKKTTELEILQSTLNLPNYPNRIECIDISNMQETAIVASNVCFIEGRPAKEFYRKYNIESVKDKPDDFASIHEVVLRRLKRAETEQDLPDLLLIDGGKGQLNAAIEAAKQFPNLAVCILSLAKSRHGKRDALNHDGGGIKSQERIFFPERELPLNLDPGSPCYRILTQIRDEAHRFAITFHRKKRSSLLHRSILDQVPGIGPALKKRLFEIYPSLDHMGKASMIELLTIRGMTKEKAAALRSILAQYQETLGE